MTSSHVLFVVNVNKCGSFMGLAAHIKANEHQEHIYNVDYWNIFKTT